MRLARNHRTRVADAEEERMNWLRENWFWVIVFVFWFWMHTKMHAGHGGHGGHGGHAKPRGPRPSDDLPAQKKENPHAQH